MGLAASYDAVTRFLLPAGGQRPADVTLQPPRKRDQPAGQSFLQPATAHDGTPVDPRIAEAVTQEFTQVAITLPVPAQEPEAGGRRLRRLVDNLPGMVFRVRNDRNWTSEFISRGSREMIGLASAACLHPPNNRYQDRVHPDDQARAREVVDAG
mgnify:CR=1 FL=1